MKKAYLFIVFFFICLAIFSQANYSGAYGYALAPTTNIHNSDKDATGPSGNLVLQKIENNKYRFWLDINIGAPSYNMGETDGTLIFVNDTASFDNTHDGAGNSCVLHFKITGNTVSISSSANPFDCGFGNGVNAAGEYAWLKAQPVLDNAWLKKEYHESPGMVVTSAKAELFQDENALRSFDKKQYLVKGDKLISIAENEKTVYTEFYTSSGKFICGWIKKTDLGSGLK